MAKFLPTEGYITFDSTQYYAININQASRTEEGRTTDGSTTGNAHEYVAGRTDQEVTFDLLIDDASAAIAPRATGAFSITAKEGTSTNKEWSWTDAVILDRTLVIAPEGTQPAVYNYRARLNGAVTETQFADA